MTFSAIVQKLWKYCNVLRDDGMSYGDFPSTGSGQALKQLTYLLVLKWRRSGRGFRQFILQQAFKGQSGK